MPEVWFSGYFRKYFFAARFRHPTLIEPDTKKPQPIAAAFLNVAITASLSY
jgi:hypothetical protein